jgi:virulence-associated protein VagC
MIGLDTLRPEQIMKILELTDSFNLNREAVMIPLALEDEGSVTLLPDGRLRIVAPKNKPFEDWLIELRTRLTDMDLATVGR